MSGLKGTSPGGRKELLDLLNAGAGKGGKQRWQVGFDSGMNRPLEGQEKIRRGVFMLKRIWIVTEFQIAGKFRQYRHSRLAKLSGNAPGKRTVVRQKLG